MRKKNNHAILKILDHTFPPNFYFNSEMVGIFNRIFNPIFTVQCSLAFVSH